MKEIISTTKAPQAIGPYSQATIAGNMVFISGQVPIDPALGKLVDGDIKDQTERVMKNLQAILSEAGCDFSNVVKTTCLLSDINNFKAMNEVYGKYFPENPPARAAFAVKDLPLGALVEIEAVAVRK
ncbi:RidA family protein [Marinilabilia rubra]|uniref:Reactive intermediate/imine deaminase n=1 Tax=Marinilabilia rubra TaxID=2162893 RepID=A0A2U2B5H1_9BACT|nr:RidA family protein [Marinilabilia rubra]PWD98283.1 reactive intermediate/imine deaminase [Marinilabilia rubra]